uniref:Uncharacterized protein n=1 Tax=Oryctolagus cuniculus TaxID=9986 RepID=A0A5F9C620_RABIT
MAAGGSVVARWPRGVALSGRHCSLFQLLFKDGKLMVQIVISSAGAGGLAEWVLMGLPGEIEARYSTILAGNLLGDLHYTSEGYIAHRSQLTCSSLLTLLSRNVALVNGPCLAWTWASSTAMPFPGGLEHRTETWTTTSQRPPNTMSAC